MLDVTVDQEIKLLKKAASEFVRKKIIPERVDYDKYPFGPSFSKILKKAFDLDFFHMHLPEKLGGLDQDINAFCAFLETVSQEDSSLAGFLITNAMSQQILINAGREECLKTIVEKADNFSRMLIAFPAFRNPIEIEPKVEAVFKDGQYLLTGKAEYLSMAGYAQYGLIPARIEGENGYSFFLIKMTDEHMIKSEPIVSLGLRACPAIDLLLEKKKADIIGRPGEGASYFKAMSSRLAAGTAAIAVGIMKGALKEAINYSRQREQGGRKLSGWSEMQMVLADMSIKTTNAELLLSRACQAVADNHPDWDKSVCAAAVYIHEAACDVASEGVQVLGGYGYMKDYGQEKRYRDAKHIQAYFGLFPMKKIRFYKQHIAREVK